MLKIAKNKWFIILKRLLILYPHPPLTLWIESKRKQRQEKLLERKERWRRGLRSLRAGISSGKRTSECRWSSTLIKSSTLRSIRRINSRQWCRWVSRWCVILKPWNFLSWIIGKRWLSDLSSNKMITAHFQGDKSRKLLQNCRNQTLNRRRKQSYLKSTALRKLRIN